MPGRVTGNGNVKEPNNLTGRRSGFPNLSCIFLLLFAISSMLLCCSSAIAEGLSGWVNLNYISTEQKEDGETILKEGSYFRNLYFTFEKPITPLISYQLNLRTNWSDFRLTDAEDRITKTYRRAIEPAFDLFLRNPMYDFSTGYRRLEQWSTAHLQNEGRRTTEFYYSRFNITPVELPSLSLQFDRQKDFDYLSPKRVDTTDTRFSGNSWYKYLYKGLDLSYNFTYRHSIDETPLSTVEKTKNYNFNGLYNISYFRSFWNGKTDVSVNYQGNYVRDKNQFFFVTPGRHPIEWGGVGLYGLPKTFPYDPTSFVLTSDLNGDMTNDDKTNRVDENINLRNVENNIGIMLSSTRQINTIYIYTDRKIGVPPRITWDVYKGTSSSIWTYVGTVTTDATPPPSVGDTYRYIISFTKEAQYFKVVNKSVIGEDVYVTEIEAYGEVIAPQTGKLTEVSNFFNQGINLSANLRPVPKLNFSLNYFLNRSDQNPVSIWNSIGGVFSNIVSKSFPEGDKLRSNILRTYGATSTWFTHRLLTTTLRLQRNEAFDNRNETDFSSNTYSLSFSSVPLPTLNTNLSLIRNDSYNFGKKETTNKSVLLSALSKLYRDVNMVIDMGYTRSKSYITDVTSNTTSIRGSVDAHLTQRLYGSLIYGLSWTSSSNNMSSNTAEGQTIITYRPGRFVNITGSFRVADTDDTTTTSEGILVDWLPLPALRLNLNYQHTNSDLEPTASDLLSAYLIWYITKFLDLQLTYSYTREERETLTENYSVGANLNCRFW